MTHNIKLAVKEFAKYTAVSFVYAFLLGLVVAMFAANIIGAVVGVGGLTVIRIATPVLGLMPHVHLFYKYNSRRSRERELPISSLYKYYMVLFAIYLLPVIPLLLNYPDVPAGATGIAMVLDIIYIAQKDLVRWGTLITGSSVIAYLLTLIFYSICLFATICFAKWRNKQKQSKQVNTTPKNNEY